MSATDELLQRANASAASFSPSDIPVAPRRRVAIVACMDARINLYRVFGLSDGDAHMIRNAGGIVTDDVIRSLAISQRLLGTEEVILVHHTDCGMLSLTDEGFAAQLEQDTGLRPPWTAGAFSDLEADVRGSMARIKADPFLPHRSSIRGFVYDVATGQLSEVVNP
jgi:carbonic anhydrase